MIVDQAGSWIILYEKWIEMGELEKWGMGREERKAKKYDRKLSLHKSDQSEDPNDGVIKGLLRIGISNYQFNLLMLLIIFSPPQCFCKLWHFVWLIWGKSKKKCWVLELDKPWTEGMEQKNEIEEEWGLGRQALWFRSAHEKETPRNAQEPWSGHWLSPKMLNGVPRQFCSYLQISGCHQLATSWHILEWHICPFLHSWMSSTMSLEYMKWFVYMHFKACFWYNEC